MKKSCKLLVQQKEQNIKNVFESNTGPALRNTVLRNTPYCVRRFLLKISDRSLTVNDSVT